MASLIKWEGLTCMHICNERLSTGVRPKSSCIIAWIITLYVVMVGSVSFADHTYFCQKKKKEVGVVSETKTLAV